MRRAERGFALLIVLWAVALLSLLTTELTSTGRSELMVAANIRNAAMAEAAADGLIYQTIVRLMSDTAAERGVDGLARSMLVPAGRATVRVTSLAGKVNPNTASEDLLNALLQEVGVAPARATNLAAAIADWRTPGRQARPHGAKTPQYQQAGLAYTPPGNPFETVDELGLVLGMTPDVLARLRPHLTVFYPGETAAADPVVVAALKLAQQLDDAVPLEGTEPDSVYAEITVALAAPDGAAATRTAIVLAGHNHLRGRYRVLRWDAAE